MMALNLHGVGDLRYEEVPRPECRPGEVLLKIKAVGICGSDIPRVFTKGTYHFPTITGHEFAGEIVEAEDAELVGRGASVLMAGAQMPASRVLAQRSPGQSASSLPKLAAEWSVWAIPLAA